MSPSQSGAVPRSSVFPLQANPYPADPRLRTRRVRSIGKCPASSPSARAITDLLENPDIKAVWVDELLHREAMTLLLGRHDKTYSLCDAVSFILMRQRNLAEALTTDRHFEQQGFRRLLCEAPS